MSMKKTGVRQMILGALGGVMCSVNIMGCYPLVPAYFAALYLENVSGFLLMGCMYIGMLFGMPLTAGIKYAVVLPVIIAAVRVTVWANDGCPAFLAGIMAAVSTVILSFGGSLLEWRDQPGMAAVFLEGAFVFGAVVLLNRLLHTALEWKPQPPEEVTHVEHGNGEKLKNYAESFQGLSRIFQSMSTGQGRYAADELGQVQNELTGKLCTSCDSCAVCWERDNAPLYGVLSQMLTSIWHAGIPGRDAEEKLEKYCKRSRDMVEEAVHVFERVSLNRAWYNRLLENRQVIAEQLDAMAYIMQDCAREERVLDGERRHVLSEIRYRAKESGIAVGDMHLVETVDGYLKLEATLRSRGAVCRQNHFWPQSLMPLGRKCGWRRTPARLSQKNPVRFCCMRIPDTAMCRELRG